MADVWSTVQASDLATWINLSRWAYAVVATAHVLAIGVLIGSILTLDLRLIGLAEWIDPQLLARLVVPIAGTALCCAIVSGGLLFVGRAGEYAAFGTFQIKMALLATALAMTLAGHRRFGLRLQRANAHQRVRIGVASMSLWLGIAISGRMIAFIHGKDDIGAQADS